MKIFTSVVLVAIAVPVMLWMSACASTAELPKGERVGEDMQPQTPVKFSAVDASPQEYAGKPVLIEGTVKSVCQKMGCWMLIEDEGRIAMVRWKDGCGGKYAFAKDAAGRRVLVQGVLSYQVMDETEAEHLKLDNENAGAHTGGFALDNVKVIMTRVEYGLDATSVMYLDEK
jgi:hypothetical protein